MKAAVAQFTMPPTKVTGSTIAVVNDTCGNLIQVAALDLWQSGSAQGQPDSRRGMPLIGYPGRPSRTADGQGSDSEAAD